MKLLGFLLQFLESSFRIDINCILGVLSYVKLGFELLRCLITCNVSKMALLCFESKEGLVA